ncbi:hypothetical protein ARAM_002676 [Aspergillus rambellii]|uniref:N-acetyltransferase domain-containing protein n=1 Tax=Aspergillus rambellii TaxID=308745 RepID=A0A0F8WGI8_9EURO|nr:hypothetical protein ARAM_002676 [Aspergillus rambellii]
MDIQILPLTQLDIPQAVECIQTVFVDDPYFLYLFNPSTYNRARNTASLSAHFLHGLGCNAPIYVAKYQNRVVGVCWWISPRPASSPPSLSERVHDWILSFRQLLANIRYAGRGGLRVDRYLQWKELQAESQAETWSSPQGYYFCNVIAVRAETRGKGVGRKLVEAVTQRADAEGVPCYLESSKGVPNLLIYEKLGFELVSEIECVDGKDICTILIV